MRLTGACAFLLSANSTYGGWLATLCSQPAHFGDNNYYGVVLYSMEQRDRKPRRPVKVLECPFIKYRPGFYQNKLALSDALGAGRYKTTLWDCSTDELKCCKLTSGMIGACVGNDVEFKVAAVSQDHYSRNYITTNSYSLGWQSCCI